MSDHPSTLSEAGARAEVFTELRGLVVQVLRYGGVSAAALGLDMGLYLALQPLMAAALAGVLSYLAGMMLHYALSARFVFAASQAKSGVRRFGEFLVSGLVGLALTAATIALIADVMHQDALLAKAVAVAVSFGATFVLRRAIVFA